MTAATTLIQSAQVNKKIDTFVNKMFKMSDGYLTEYNNGPSKSKLNRNMINLTFEAFRKKKEVQGYNP